MNKELIDKLSKFKDDNDEFRIWLNEIGLSGTGYASLKSYELSEAVQIVINKYKANWNETN